jgi:hypothetical protein
MRTLVTEEEYKVFASITGDKSNEQIVELLAFSSLIVEKYMGITFAGTGTSVLMYTQANRTDYFLDVVGVIDTFGYTVRSTGEVIAFETPEHFIQQDDKLILIATPTSDLDTMALNLIGANEASAEVKLAIMILTQYYYKKEYNTTGAATSGQQIDYQESKSLPNSVRTILDFHRII